MKFYYILIGALISFGNCFAQANGVMVEGPNYNGIIFNQNFKLNPNDTVTRWMPSETDVKILEDNLKIFMANQNKKNRINQVGNCPVISKNLDKYIRQYAGYVSPKGEKYIYVNCFWDEPDPFNKDWKIKLIQVLDGCSYYWQIHYNVSQKKFSGFSVNGIG